MRDAILPLELIEKYDKNLFNDRVKANYLVINKEGKLLKEEIIVALDSWWDINDYLKGFKYIKGFWANSVTSEGLRVLIATDDMTDVSDGKKDNHVSDILSNIELEKEEKIDFLDRMVNNYLDVMEYIEEGKIIIETWKCEEMEKDINAETLYKLTTKLIGEIKPVGSTDVDKERLNNLNILITLLGQLTNDVNNVVDNKDDFRKSVSGIGKKVFNYFENEYEIIGEILKEEQ